MNARQIISSFLITSLVGGSVAAQPGGTDPSQPAPTGQPAPAQPTGQQPTPATPANGPGVGAGTTVDTRPVTLSKDELDQLTDIESEYERFILSANQHDSRMRTIAKREFDARTTDLTNRYAERIAKKEAERSRRHGDTIAALEKFVKDHPAHEQFTPDKMFQLADLYLDRADDEVEAKLTAQENAGGPAPDAVAIVADYQPALNLWEDILKRFPTYRQTPSTLYLLAYYGKTKDERRSLQIFLSLACANKYKWSDPPTPPPSRAEAIKRVERKQLRDPYADCQPYQNADAELVRHAWVRGIADYHFTIPGEIDDGIAAYLKVANGGQDSKLYAESLYKLAWSYYKRDMLKDAIARFDESVRLYDSIVAAGNTPALELREESIQYIAVAFTDPWEGETGADPIKAMQRAKDFYKGKENDPHVRDVWVALGKAFGDLGTWEQAIESYRIALGPPWELHPKNPVVHQEIVNAYESKGEKDNADAAAAELATKYAPGTAWYAANEKDREAMESQRRIAERALYAAARNTHAAATARRKEWEAGKKDPAGRQEYLAMYSKAVDLYRAFIDTYADSDYVYEFNYNMGEALYWSERYMESVVQYQWVRDHRDLGTAFYIEAARSIVEAYEAEAARQVAAGSLVALKVPTAAELKALPQPLQKQPIPDVYLKLQAEYDNYQNIVNDPQVAPLHGINAALISLAYLHTDDALARFQKVMDKFCGQEAAAKAKDGMIALYEVQQNFDAIEQVNKKFIAAKCGDQKKIDDAIAQNRSLNFSRANLLYQNKQYVAAAEAFYRFYKTAPATDPDRPIALYNTAVSYKLADRPQTAISLFKEFAANPAKNFRESPYYLDAIRLQASAYQAAFQYGDAVRTYLELYETTKKAKRLGIKPPEPIPGEQPRTLEQIGLDAVFNAALASELNRDFKKAIELYTNYQRIEPDRRKKDRALWSVVGIYRQSSDLVNMTEAQQTWRTRYGKDAGNEDDYVQSFYDEAAMRRRRGQMPQARAAGQATIDAWKARGSQKNTRGAKLAAEWQLAQAEDHFTTTWDKYAVTKAARTVAEAEATGKALTAQKTKAEDKYLALDPYGIAEMSMAAKVRYGEIQYQYSTKLADAPLPVPISKAGGDVQANYQAKLDANVKKYLDEARSQWVEVVDIAKKNGVSNRWTRLAQENLGREFPAEFTVLRQEIIQGTDAP